MAGSRLVIYVAPESGELEKEPGDGEDGAEEALIQPLQQPPRRDAAKVRERRRRRVAMTGCGSEDELWGGGANKWPPLDRRRNEGKRVGKFPED